MPNPVCPRVHTVPFWYLHRTLSTCMIIHSVSTASERRFLHHPFRIAQTVILVDTFLRALINICLLPRHFSVTEGQDLFSVHCPDPRAETTVPGHNKYLKTCLTRRKSAEKAPAPGKSQRIAIAARVTLPTQRPDSRRRDFWAVLGRASRCEQEVL